MRDHLPLKLNSHMPTEDICDNASGIASINIASEETPLSTDAGSDKEEEKSADFYAVMKDSLFKAFKAMDKDLRLHGNIDCFFSGTTAVTVVKQVSLFLSFFPRITLIYSFVSLFSNSI